MKIILDSVQLALIGILSIIILITFFIMAHNVNKIRKSIAVSSKSDYFDKIDLAIFKRNNVEAKELLYELLFKLWRKGDVTPFDRIKSFEEPIRLLKSLKEEVPAEITDFIEKHR